MQCWGLEPLPQHPPPSSHPDSPESEKTETTFTFPAPVQPVSLPSPTSTDVSNLGKRVLFLRAGIGNPVTLCCLLTNSGAAVSPAGRSVHRGRQLFPGPRALLAGRLTPAAAAGHPPESRGRVGRAALVVETCARPHQLRLRVGD